MNEPFSPEPRPESVPPLSDKFSDVERESREAAARRASESERIATACNSADACCRSIRDFIHENPCLSVGIAFGVGLIAGCGLRTHDYR